MLIHQWVYEFLWCMMIPFLISDDVTWNKQKKYYENIIFQRIAELIYTAFFINTGIACCMNKMGEVYCTGVTPEYACWCIRCCPKRNWLYCIRVSGIWCIWCWLLWNRYGWPPEIENILVEWPEIQFIAPWTIST